MANTNPHYMYFASANEVRGLLAGLGYSKIGNPKATNGRWVKGDRTIQIGMCLAANYRTGQSSGGGFAPWVYAVPKAVFA